MHKRKGWRENVAKEEGRRNKRKRERGSRKEGKKGRKMDFINIGKVELRC